MFYDINITVGTIWLVTLADHVDGISEKASQTTAVA